MGVPENDRPRPPERRVRQLVVGRERVSSVAVGVESGLVAPVAPVGVAVEAGRGPPTPVVDDEGLVHTGQVHVTPVGHTFSARAPVPVPVPPPVPAEEHSRLDRWNDSKPETRSGPWVVDVVGRGSRPRKGK